MAILQISKIQVRRGRSGESGVPQLDSGEIAWAIDSQELYIGNGEINEGAPFVGNTRVLTENDNILDLARGYKFGVDSADTLSTSKRKLREKLDEIQVSVNDFKDVGDTDNQAFSKAIDGLYDTVLNNNLDNKYKKVLVVPNGSYTFASPVALRNEIIIRGESRDNVVISGAFTAGSAISATFENLTVAGAVSLSSANRIQFDNIQFSSTGEVTGTATQLIINNPVINNNAVLPIVKATTPSTTVNNIIASSGVRAGKFLQSAGKASTVSFSIPQTANQKIFETIATNQTINIDYRIEYLGTTKIGTLKVVSDGSTVSQTDNYTFSGTFNNSTIANIDASLDGGKITIDFTVTNGQQGSITYDATYAI